MVLSEPYLGHRSNVNDDLYLWLRKKIKICVAQAGFKPVHAFGSAWETLSLNHQTIRTVAYLWVLCFNKDIYAYNSIVKLKRLNHALSAVFFKIMFLACSGAEFELLFYLGCNLFM